MNKYLSKRTIHINHKTINKNIHHHHHDRERESARERERERESKIQSHCRKRILILHSQRHLRSVTGPE